jgi:hypothetical protein
MRKLTLAIGLLFGLVLTGLVAGTARADRPQVETFSGSFTDTGTCPGITIETTFDIRLIIFEESEDTFVAHHDEIYTLTANGKTLIDNDHFNTRFTGDVLRYTGAVFNIQGPGAGKLLMDVGILIFNGETGEVIFQGGPHPAFYGDFQALCDYLADP